LGKEYEEGNSAKTVARRLASIKSLFRYLVQTEVITDNPAMHVSSPKIEKRLPIVIQQKRIESLMIQPKIQDSKIKKENKKSRKGSRKRLLRNTAILELFYATGIRLSELVNLNIGSINENEMLLKVMGKGEKERIVPFGKPAKIALKAYLKKRNLNFQSSPEIPLFCSWHENRIGVRRVQVILENYLAVVLGSEDNYSREGANPHTLRHSFATHLIEENVDIRLIQELLGHSSLSSTQIYTKVNPKKMKEIYTDAHPHG
jgi:site-specific recombinase XerD